MKHAHKIFLRWTSCFIAFILIASCGYETRNTQPAGFGVGKWKGYEVSQWDSNWSYTYELTLYNDGTAECYITSHGPSEDCKEYGMGNWNKKSSSFGDRQYYWTEIKITAGRRLHCFYIDKWGNAYHPFGREVWQAIRDDKPTYKFQKIN